MTPSGCSFLFQPGGAESYSFSGFSEEERMIYSTARTFMEREVLPYIDLLEEGKIEKQRELLRRAGEIGLLGIEIPETYGGLGLGFKTALHTAEALARYPSFAVSWGAHTGIGTLPIVYFGTEEQKARYLPLLARGEYIAAYALTEPQAGSDALNAQTVAVLKDGRWILNGQKQFITNAGFADLFVVFAKVDGKAFSAFLVERGFPGVSVGGEEQKLGIKGSSTRQVFFEEVPVPQGNLLGEVGKGHKVAFTILNLGRLKLAGGTLGGCRECLKLATTYALERRQFGSALLSFGAIRQKISDMAVRSFALESLCYRAASDMDQALSEILRNSPDDEKARAVIEEFSIECSIAKVFGSEALDFASDETLQIYGGYGFLKDYPVERYYRDQRINRIFEGTNEINRLLMAATFLKRAGEGRLPVWDLLTETREIIEGKRVLPEFPGFLGKERKAVEALKRLLAYTTYLFVEKELANIKEQQEQLLILANALIDLYAADSVISRTLRSYEEKREEVELLEKMCYIFVASAVERIQGSLLRLLDNEFSGEELEKHRHVVEQLTPFLPLKTIQLKREIARQVGERRGEIFLEGN